MHLPFVVVALLALAAGPTPKTDPCALRVEIDKLNDTPAAGLETAQTGLVRRVEETPDLVARACLKVVAARAAMARATPSAARDAAALLAEARGALPTITEAIDVLRAQALITSGQLDDADALIAQIPASAPGRRRASVLAIEARPGKASQAIEGYNALANDDRAEEPFALPRMCALLRYADPGQFAACAERLLVSYPGSPAARALEKDVLDGRLFRTARARAERVQALLRSARPIRAAQEALALKRDGLAQSSLVELEVATVTALTRAGREEEALSTSARLVSAGDTAPDVWWKARAWALGKAGKPLEAESTWTILAAKTADRSLKADASFAAAFALYEADQRDAALQRFKDIASMTVQTPFEMPTRWYTALLLLLLNKPADAAKVLEGLVVDAPTDVEADKHRYWLGRALQDSGKTAEGKAILRKLTVDRPLDYYGLLARSQLKLPPVAGAKGRVALRSAADDAGARRARLLFGLGFDAEAALAARSRGGTLADIALAQEVGDAAYGWRLGPSYLPRSPLSGGAINKSPGWRASFAAPWGSDVESAAAAAQISPSFLYAIMRTESGFQPTATSIAGAQGVMQLLPSAVRLAARLRGDTTPIRPERIFEPRVAVGLGATLLGTWKRELGSTALAAAAYNGGSENAAAWSKAFGALPAELFVERIPYLETRNYVKRVLATQATYDALDGKPAQLDLPDPLPAAGSSFTPMPVDE